MNPGHRNPLIWIWYNIVRPLFLLSSVLPFVVATSEFAHVWSKGMDDRRLMVGRNILESMYLNAGLIGLYGIGLVYRLVYGTDRRIKSGRTLTAKERVIGKSVFGLFALSGLLLLVSYSGERKSLMRYGIVGKVDGKKYHTLAKYNSPSEARKARPNIDGYPYLGIDVTDTNMNMLIIARTGGYMALGAAFGSVLSYVASRMTKNIPNKSDDVSKN